MKRTAIIGATLLVATIAVFGVLAVNADQRPTAGPAPNPAEAAAAPAARSRAPQLTPSVLAQGSATHETGNARFEQSLAAVDQAAQDTAVALMQERDPERRAKLQRYAEAIQQIRDSLR